MNKHTLLTSCVLSLALLAATSAHAQTATQSPSYTPPYATQSQAYGSDQPVYALKAPSSSGSTYQSARGAFSPMTARIVSDPLYQPLQGQIEGITAYTLGLPSSTVYNSAGVKRTESNSTNSTFAQTVAYGVTDEFALRLLENYSFGHTYRDNQINGNTTSSSVSGFSDPTVSAAYRFIDQRRAHPVSSTVDLSYTPDMIDSEAAGGGQSGNEGAGRQSGTMSVDVGREMKNFTIDGITGLSYEGKRRYTNLGNNDNFQVDPFWNYFFGLRSQVRFTERLSLNADYRYTVQDSTNNTNNTTGLSFAQSNPNFSDFTLAFNYHFIPNRLVGQLSYDYYDYANSSNTYATAPTDSTTTKDQTNNVIGARLLYVFN